MLFLLVLLACGPESDTGTSCRSGAVSDHQGIEMAFICPGRFTMGSPEDEVGHGEEEQQHEVTLTHGFYIGVNEVTREQFVHHLGFEPWNNADCGETSCMVRTLSV